MCVCVGCVGGGCRADEPPRLHSDPCATVESVKAASDIYAPVSGDVVSVNEALEEDPGLVNTSPQQDGWMWRMTIAHNNELKALLSEDAYQELIDSDDH